MRKTNLNQLVTVFNSNKNFPTTRTQLNFIANALSQSNREPNHKQRNRRGRFVQFISFHTFFSFFSSMRFLLFSLAAALLVASPLVSSQQLTEETCVPMCVKILLNNVKDAGATLGPDDQSTIDTNCKLNCKTTMNFEPKPINPVKVAQGIQALQADFDRCFNLERLSCAWRPVEHLTLALDFNNAKRSILDNDPMACLRVSDKSCKAQLKIVQTPPRRTGAKVKESKSEAELDSAGELDFASPLQRFRDSRKGNSIEINVQVN